MNKEKLAREIYNAVQKEQAAIKDIVPMETTVNVRTAPKRISMPPNLMVFQAAAYLAATKLNASANRVLMYFFSKSVYENFIGIDISSLMEEMNMSKPTVVNALKDLEAYNILIKFQNTKDKRRHDYFINPIAAWKGNSYTWNQTKKRMTVDNPKQLKLGYGENI